MFKFQITALVVIPMSWQYWVLVESLIVGGGIIFVVLSNLGQKLIDRDRNNQIGQSGGHSEEELKTLHIYENKINITDATD
jgi:hypothetical protein